MGGGIFRGSLHKIILQAGAQYITSPAACDLDVFHHITAYIHNMHAIELSTGLCERADPASVERS